MGFVLLEDFGEEIVELIWIEFVGFAHNNKSIDWSLSNALFNALIDFSFSSSQKSKFLRHGCVIVAKRWKSVIYHADFILRSRIPNQKKYYK